MKGMAEEKWKQVADRLERTTTLSQRQAEVFALARLGKYNRRETAARLDISPTTVSRHAGELDEKIDRSEELLRIDENVPYCTTVGHADCHNAEAYIFENTRLPNSHFDRPTERYRVQLTWIESPYDMDFRHPQSREITDQVGFRNKFTLIENLTDGVLTQDFRSTACLYSALHEAIGDETDIPPFETLYNGPDPSEKGISFVISAGLLTATDLRPFLDTPATPPSDLVFGTHGESGDPVEYDIRDGDVTVLPGTPADKTAALLVNRHLRGADDPPSIICLDTVGAFGFVPREHTYTITNGGEEAMETLDDDFGRLSRIALHPSLETEFDGPGPIGVHPTSDIDGCSPPDIFDRTITAILDRLSESDTPACLFVKDAHVLDDGTQEALMSAAADDDSPLISWVCLTQLPDECPLVATSDALETNGIILPDPDEVHGEWAESVLTDEQIRFLQTEDGAGDRTELRQLLSAPGESTWTPVKTTYTTEERAAPPLDEI